MAATLKNISRQPVVLILDHPAFATKANGWQRTSMHFGSSTGDGQRVVSEVRRSHPGSLTILPGESVTGLHSAIAHCSQVAQLKAQRILELTEAEEPQPSADARNALVSQPKPKPVAAKE